MKVECQSCGFSYNTSGHYGETSEWCPKCEDEEYFGVPETETLGRCEACGYTEPEVFFYYSEVGTTHECPTCDDISEFKRV